ncbi:MAG: hypothetical protein WD872_14800 [Pirellulaceae bacterium]
MGKKNTSRQNPYIGKAGHLAVMAEFALLGYNVALPEIDKGDDIYVVNDASGKLWRVQVKSATVQRIRGEGFQVRILESQITTAPVNGAPDLHFVFALRQIERWRFIVMSRSTLKNYIDEKESQGKPFGHLDDTGRRALGLTFQHNNPNEILCSATSWTQHLSSWEQEWPYLDHAVPPVGECALEENEWPRTITM